MIDDHNIIIKIYNSPLYKKTGENTLEFLVKTPHKKNPTANYPSHNVTYLRCKIFFLLQVQSQPFYHLRCYLRAW